MRLLGDRAELIDRVDGADLGRLGDRDEPRLVVVDVAAPRLPPPHRRRFELAVNRLGLEQLDPRPALRRPALVDVDVRAGNADDGVLGARDRVDRKHVRGGPVEDREAERLRPEVLADQLVEALRPSILAVGAGVVDVCAGDRLEHLRMGAGVVVGGEAARVRARGGAHGCSSRRWPFIRPAASEQR